MAGLHTWTGLLLGWVLYFMFLTGTAGYFDTEIGYWMRPEVPQRATSMSASDALALAQRRLETVAPRAEGWTLYPPSGHDVPEPTLYWRAVGAGGAISNGSEVLDRTTGGPLEARDTGGGDTLYQMHYLLRYLPSAPAYWIVGVATMFMLIAIVSGVITHKRIFRDFFTFRPHKGQRSWLDAHNALGVLALPFHLLITYSGLVFFCFTYMPLIVAASYGTGNTNRDVFFDEVFRRGGGAERANVAAPLSSIERMVAAAEQRWGKGQIRSIDVRYPGDANARVTFTRTHVSPTSNGDRMTFDGVSGALLAESLAPRTGPMLVNDTLMSLHEGLFSGTALRWLYFLSGLAGTAMIGTGLVHWTAKRRKRETPAHAGLALVERLNIGTIAGLPIAIAAYFWANRLLPLDLAERAEWEAHVLFIVWAAMLAHAALRPMRRAWLEQMALAAAAYALLPVLNAFTTHRHLAVSLPAGDWVFAGFDLTMLAFGAVFATVAFALWQRRQRAQRVEEMAGPSASLHAETVS